VYELPCDPTSLVKWRKRIGPGRMEKLLAETIAAAPVIGHLKQDHRMKRNHLQGKNGDCINALLVGCGFNLRKLTRVFFWPFFGWADPALEIDLVLPAAARSF